MSRNYERDDREDYSRRQQQNRQGQNRWQNNREDENGWTGQNQENRNPRGDQDYNRGEGRYQGMQDRGNRGNERDMWEGGGGQRSGNEGRNWNREYNYGMEGNQGSQQGGQRSFDRGGGYQGGNFQDESQYGMGGNRNERFEGSQRENFDGRGSWNQGMPGREGQRQNNNWSPEMGGWNQELEGNRWNEGTRYGGQQGEHSGRGPRGFKRGDERIEEDVNEQLTRHSRIDASDIEVSVQNGEVTLRGHVDHRESKRLAEDIAESVFGVKEVSNQIKVKQKGHTEENRHEMETSGKQRKAS
jgi:osmotically-inducible protein OsmY